MKLLIFVTMMLFSASNFAEEICAKKLARIVPRQCCLTIFGCPFFIFAPDMFGDAYNSYCFVDIFKDVHTYVIDKSSGLNPTVPSNVQREYDILVKIFPESKIKRKELIAVLEEIGQGSSKSAACKYFYGFNGYPIRMIFADGKLDYYNDLKTLPLDRREREKVLTNRREAKSAAKRWKHEQKLQEAKIRNEESSSSD